VGVSRRHHDRLEDVRLADVEESQFMALSHLSNVPFPEPDRPRRVMVTTQVTPTQDKDVELLDRLAEARRVLLEQVRQRIVGQQEVIDGILTAILAGGHALLVGVPGLAKTLIVSTVAEALRLKFARIQFTPDLMPGDITGTEIIEESGAGKRAFRFVHGPVFANVVLADEINRTPPKTQAALLQAMQEHAVTAAGTTYPLPEPFFVLATQNPIEQEGTYPLPEAQLDRFMLELRVRYPSREEEERIVVETTGDEPRAVRPVLTAADLLEMQHLVRRIPVSQPVVRAAVGLARMTRPGEPDAVPAVDEYVSWGAGPRASQFLVLGAKAQAAMDGRPMADLDDVRKVALAVLRHRLVINFAAEAAGRTAESICAELIDGEGWMR
jgi:MoxR-like ATPase